MPYKRVHGGYTKKGSPPGKGGFLRNPKQYEKLKEKGFDKSTAAAISNASWRKGHVKKAKDPFGSSASAVGGALLGASTTKMTPKQRAKWGTYVKRVYTGQEASTPKFVKKDPGILKPARLGRIKKELPRYGMTRFGRVHILHQHSKDHFMVLDKTDTKRLVHRSEITFVKNPKLKPRPIKKLVTDAQLRRRKKLAAGIGYTAAGIGIGTLAAKGGQGVLRAAGKRAAHIHPLPGGHWQTKAAEHIGQHTQTALIVGSGVGAFGAINGAGIQRAEAERKHLKKAVGGMNRAINSTAAEIGRVTGPPQKTDRPPSVKNTVKGTLKAVSTGSVPEMPPMIPGQKMIRRIDNSVNKGLGRGLKEGWKAADKTRLSPLNVRHGPKATEIAGRKTGAFAHDFSEGYSRRVHPRDEVEAGKVTTRENAVYPAAHQAGHLTRRYGAPAVVIGGGYYTGKKIGGRRSKVNKSQGALVPLSTEVVKTYGYDPEYNRHRRSGVYSGTAAAVGTAAVAGAGHQGYKAVRAKGNAINRAKSGVKGGGKLTSIRVSRGSLVHGSRAAGLAAAGGTAYLIGHKIKQKQTQGDWRSYA